MKATVYSLIDNATGKPFYVGSTKVELRIRLRIHKSSVKKSTAPVYKYIRENNITFDIYPLEIFDCKHSYAKNKKEGEWYDKLTSAGATLYNSHRPLGSDNGINFTDKRLIKLLSNGYTLKSIVKRLKTTMQLASVRLLVLKQRTGCKSNIELVALFLREGFIN
jgi:hypothetical protein